MKRLPLKQRATFDKKKTHHCKDISSLNASSIRPLQLRQKQETYVGPTKNPFKNRSLDISNWSQAPWNEWKCLNQLRSGVGRCKADLRKVGYLHGDDSTCLCDTDQTMDHLLSTPAGSEKHQDLAAFKARAKGCVRHS
ncbi:hypothetical protein ElyMa_001804900 [Elysia marginata]|uniref:Extracellular sulfatase C-terminal domain-containing protein n=1 Tax=Elysia marginata TaxID=1093978 RepID=A0AAV4EGM8_9GAST|nr:hypothetical protein ElyMa_001804900 [Elysia marginata]